MSRRALNYTEDGAQLFAGAAAAIIGDIESAVGGLPKDKAGIRLHGLEALRPLLKGEGSIGALAVRTIGAGARPVRAILFDKTEATNWSLGWHQDRTIAVRKRVDVSGFGPWTVKSDILHVAPPFDVLARMVTLRIHLDPVSRINAPLQVAPGSHHLGRIAEAEIDGVVARCGVATCEAAAGDVWLCATPILHASEAAIAPRRRRVLQVDYAAGNLPGGLQWLGI
jgi:hypothetical protein